MPLSLAIPRAVAYGRLCLPRMSIIQQSRRLSLAQVLNNGKDEIYAAEYSLDDELELDKTHYPNLSIDRESRYATVDGGHNVVVVQPWNSFANFDEFTDPELQLDECVSLVNTIPNWRAIGKKVVFAKATNKNNLFGRDSFETFKEFIHSHQGVTAVMFGKENLSGVQLATLESGLKLPCYDRFTTVLTILRKQAKTREAKIQVALAELPYVRAHLKEIQQSSMLRHDSESLKLLVGDLGDRYYKHRMGIIDERQNKLVKLLRQLENQRSLTKKHRLKERIPTVSVVGYTNSGKTSLIKYLTNDQSLAPKDSLFATLDVTVHGMKLPSFKEVLLVDTIGFISRIPHLLLGAFSASLKDVQDSNLILHVLDVTHPDHKLQYSTVNRALEALKVSKKLMETKINVGNKVDLVGESGLRPGLPKCDFLVSATNGQNMRELAQTMDQRLLQRMGLRDLTLRIPTGGSEYSWLLKNSSIYESKVDQSDENYLLCQVRLDNRLIGRYRKAFGQDTIKEIEPEANELYDE